MADNRASTANPRPLVEALDRLARFENDVFPVISVYLDARSDGRGRDHFQPFVRKELAAKAAAFPLRSPARESFDEDSARIERFLDREVRPSANGIAIFACSKGGLFETLQVEAPFVENSFSVARHPQLYPLARLIDEYPKYAVVVSDTRFARIFVFALGREVSEKSFESDSLPRAKGGWSQMHYQRHVDEHRAEHAREVVETLERIVASQRIDHIVLAGDEVAIPLIQEKLTKPLEAKLISTLRVDMKRAGEADILEATMQALREWDARTDEERARKLLDEFLAGGLAVIGPEDTSAALDRGQVDELLISATLDRPGGGALPEREGLEPPGAPPSGAQAGVPGWADELVLRARQTGARVTFIEDPALLTPARDVGAFLRHRLAS